MSSTILLGCMTCQSVWLTAGTYAGRCADEGEATVTASSHAPLDVLSDQLRELVGRWNIDGEHSAVTFAVRHMMVSTVRGRFDDFVGASEVRADGSVDASASIRTQSISTGNSERDDHLRTNEFLATDVHPEITFVATGIERLDAEGGRLAGELTIKNVTRPVSLDVALNGFVASDWKGRPRVSLTARTSINRKDFGVNWNQVLEAGGVLISEKVEIEMDIAATREE